MSVHLWKNSSTLSNATLTCHPKTTCAVRLGVTISLAKRVAIIPVLQPYFRHRYPTGSQPLSLQLGGAQGASPPQTGTYRKITGSKSRRHYPYFPDKTKVIMNTWPMAVLAVTLAEGADVPVPDIRSQRCHHEQRYALPCGWTG